MSLQDQTVSTATGRAAERHWANPMTAGVNFAASLELEKVSHAIGAMPILDDVSLRVEAGEVVALLGPSGSGKTTLLRIIAGLERQIAGRVLLDDREIAGPTNFVPAENRGIGLVFQDYALFPHLNILDNVKFGLTRMARGPARDYARHTLSLVGMERFEQSYPHELSGGEQQRVALARALAPRPGILLMDEPFSGLDSRLRDAVREASLALLRETRATAMIVTHDPEEALKMSDRIALMRAGKVVQYGACADFFVKPENLFVAGFFGELNLFSSTVDGNQAVTPIGTVPAKNFATGTRVLVAVRQSDMIISADGGGGGAKAVIRGRRFMGISEHIDAVIVDGDLPVAARIPAGSLDAAAKTIFISAQPGRLMVFAGEDAGAEQKMLA